MTAAYRLKGFGWFGGCVAVVLGFYLVSLQVAVERKKLDGVNGKIRSAERDIRALETEFDTRANLAQLEKWNGDTLALAAPVASQYVSDESALAAIDVNAPTGAPGTQMAALVVPSRMDITAAAPAPVAAVVQAAVVRTGAVQTASAPNNPSVIRAVSVHKVTRDDPAMAQIATAMRRAAAVAKVRPQAVAMLDRKLLSDTTLGDILSGARHEAGRPR